MITTNVLMMSVILMLDASTPPRLAMITTCALKMSVIQNKDVFIPKSNVTMELLAAKILAILPMDNANTFMITLNAKPLKNVPLEYVPIKDVNSKMINLENALKLKISAKIAKQRILAKKLIVKFPTISPQNAILKKRTVTMELNAPKILAIPKLENVFIPKSNLKNAIDQFAKIFLIALLMLKKMN